MKSGRDVSKREDCAQGGPTKKNGNCTVPGDDGLPVQCVGAWAKDKHDYLGRYIEATKGARSKFLSSAPGRSGGAAFIDLFAGPGRARIRTSGRIITGSPLIALAHQAAPFIRVLLAEKDAENVAALTERTARYGERVSIFAGDCNNTIDEIIEEVPPSGLNMALVDPYSLRALRYETLRKLAVVQRMDLIVHFSTMDFKRNFSRERQFITQALGTESWKETVRGAGDVVKLANVLKQQLAPFGYEQRKVRIVPIVQSTNVPIYHLVYASKNPLGNKIWDTIAKTTAGGQAGWNF